MKYIDTILIGGVVALGGFVRFFPLGFKSLWLDEAISAYYLRYSPGETLWRSLAPGALHPPLFFLTLQAWSNCWGDSEVALRSLAALMGTLTILGTYLIILALYRLDGEITPWSRGDKWAALLAAFLVALNPLHIHLSQIVRGYTFATCCLVFSGWLLLRSLREDTRSIWPLVSASILGAAACYTHYLAILPILSLLVTAVAFLRIQSDKKSGRLPADPDLSPAVPLPQSEYKGDRLRKATVTLVILAVAIAPPCMVAYSRAEHWKRSGPPLFVLSGSRIPYETLQALCFTPDVHPSSPREIAWLTMALLAGVQVLLVVLAGWGRWFLLVSGIFPASVLIAVSILTRRNIYSGYYLVFPQLFWLAGLAFIVARIPNGFIRSTATLTIALIALASYGHSWKTIGPVPVEGISRATRFVAKAKLQGEPVFCMSPHTYFKVAYYARAEFKPKLVIDRKKGERAFGSHYFRDDDVIDQDRLANLDVPGVWLISTKPDPKHYGWTLMQSYQHNNCDLFQNDPVWLLHYDARRPRR
ncbi:Dolichyl-phosphate-mannose-protein mannosyltransferase [Singulisphaera sp. GP187]|uniref:glycosyltransferase family 39 protein n=1 Tax=Singulisphaera sp. GP187 TaxID=1882752 RepID=UPI00092A6614|nr:glycosyltransferase family 39 protein [Singulisphaera sp. GP187]SIO10210.1 Dolichyl-phosphate-mannose-protein mannosyltransferase [Singulisphaera sp. GP187]